MTDDLLPEKLSPAAKRQRRRYIAEAKTAIEKGDKAYAELGQALWALQDYWHSTSRPWNRPRC